MSFFRNILRVARDFFVRYPAVLSGYMIYGYLFVTIMHYFVKAKELSFNLNLYDIYETFDALPFMWCLAVALVKVINVRTKLLESEKQRILVQKEIEIKHAQLLAMQETVRGLQHYVNDPLSVIVLSASLAQKAAQNNSEVINNLSNVERSAEKIQKALNGFSAVKSYASESVDYSKHKMVFLHPNLTDKMSDAALAY